MKLLIFTDNHFCQYSSILRSRGNKYSTRLENQIMSLNWVNKIAVERGCDEIISMGDFFDKSTINAEETTALTEIKWADLPLKFIVGNHEIMKNDNSCSSTHLFKLIPNAEVIDSPRVIDGIGYLPYTLEANKKSLTEYFNPVPELIFSHNDLKGIVINDYVFKEGVDVNEIKKYCKLFVNGHIHSGSVIDSKIINLGNLTGQNFSENAFFYKHKILIVDTETLEYELIENPYAINFYKCEGLNQIKKIKDEHAVISVTCYDSEVEAVRECINKINPIAARTVIKYKSNGTSYDGFEDIENVDLSVDHIEKFREFIHSTLGNSELVEGELNKIIG